MLKLTNQLRYLWVIIWVFPMTSILAQPINDECNTAILLPEVLRYCSKAEEFNNIDATPSGFAAPSNWLNGQRSHDVWFKFKALKTAVRVTVIGRNGISNYKGTLNEPEIAIYSGNCTLINLKQSGSDVPGDNALELYLSQLTVGTEYIIRVDARGDNTGTFQLCVDQSNPPVLSGSDCISGSILCDKETVLVEKTIGEGDDPNEMAYNCFETQAGEKDSKWFRWTCKTSGSLELALTPNNEPDDIDFVIWELPNGINDCTGSILLRCMAAGTRDGPTSPCYGTTGLRPGENDISEPAGCDRGQNNWIAPLQLEAGKSYALGISNFSQSGSGFTLDWGGDAEFLGPEADFVVNPASGLKCDEVFRVTDLSGFANGQVTGWQWNFGEDAEPQSDSTQGPHQVMYSSFGEKSISLTITTDLGCQVTIIRNIYVEPCCEDLEDLVVQLDSIEHLKCGGDSTGVFSIAATGGSPEYEFSIDGENYKVPGVFEGLTAGTYEAYVRDEKGCEDTILVTINEPPPLSVNAGPDQTITLGEDLTIDAYVTPQGSQVSYKWTGGAPGDIECDTCRRTRVFPTMGTTTYVIMVVDSNGCIALDSLTIFVEIVRPYFAPNVISANGDNINDVFTIFGGKGLTAIITLEVYDRWGELVYKGENFPPGEDGISLGYGWDGTFHDRKMASAVFAYKADLRYIDDVVISVSGSFTIVR